MRSTARRNVFHLISLWAAALLAVPALACHSTGDSEEPWGEPEPFVPLPDEGPETLGFFLTRFDRSLEQWSEAKVTSASARDQNMLLALEDNMQERARKHRVELLATLESGAPVNRRIAAAALGFTHDPTVLGPLLAALGDRDPELVQKALLALGVLALPETPVTEIRRLLLSDVDGWTRNNAAFALLALARAGNGSDELKEACRTALGDAEPGVRAQCGSALGVLADPVAVPLLSNLLFDPVNLVALAASAALARIGRQHLEQKGTVARALSGGLEQVEADRRGHLLGALRWLADDNLGEDAGPWREWAHKLP